MCSFLRQLQRLNRSDYIINNHGRLSMNYPESINPDSVLPYMETGKSTLQDHFNYKQKTFCCCCRVPQLNTLKGSGLGGGGQGLPSISAVHWMHSIQWEDSVSEHSITPHHMGSHTPSSEDKQDSCQNCWTYRRDARGIVVSSDDDGLELLLNAMAWQPALDVGDLEVWHRLGLSSIHHHLEPVGCGRAEQCWNQKKQPSLSFSEAGMKALSGNRHKTNDLMCHFI